MRASARRAAAMMLQDPDSKASQRWVNRTYKDLTVMAHPSAVEEIRVSPHHVAKVKDLLNALANGENRGNFERLAHQGEGDVYSLRINKKDRLVIRLASGESLVNLSVVTILAAQGHYDDIGRRLSGTAFESIQLD